MTRAKPVHTNMDQFPVEDNCLLIGGISLPELVEKVGRTPFYAYDKQVIARQVKSFRQHIPSSIRLHYAIKANPMPELVQYMAGLVDGFDLASQGEMNVA